MPRVFGWTSVWHGARGMIGAAVVLCPTTNRPSPHQGGPEPLSVRVTQIATAFRVQHRIPGLAVGIVWRGHAVYARGFGLTRIGTGHPATSKTVFHMASVTKTLVATAVVQLVERGLVDLDAPVTRYLPTFTMRDPRYRAITVRQLLAHTSGMPDVTDYRWDHPEYDAGALARYVAGLRDSTLRSLPGREWHYSNIGFEVLAQMLAAVSHEDFESYVRHAILSPLGMRHSSLLLTDIDSTDLAWGHTWQQGASVPSASYPYNRPHAGSSTLHASIDDMLRWAMVNLRHGTLDGRSIISRHGHALLWKPERNITADLRAIYDRAGLPFAYEQCSIALAWFLCNRHGRQLVFHPGDDVGFETDLVLVPSTQAAIVVMANSDDADVEQLVRQLEDALAEP